MSRLADVERRIHKNGVVGFRQAGGDIMPVEMDELLVRLVREIDLRAVEKDYDALIQKTFELELKLEEAHRVIVSQAIQIHTLTENHNAEARD